MDKHTPGPWEVIQNGPQIDIHARIRPAGENTREITIVADVDNVNARLIASAPELLAVLKRTASQYSEFLVETKLTKDPFHNRLLKDIEYVIAKAEGHHE